MFYKDHPLLSERSLGMIWPLHLLCFKSLHWREQKRGLFSASICDAFMGRFVRFIVNGSLIRLWMSNLWTLGLCVCMFGSVQLEFEMCWSSLCCANASHSERSYDERMTFDWSARFEPNADRTERLLFINGSMEAEGNRWSEDHSQTVCFWKVRLELTKNIEN